MSSVVLVESRSNSMLNKIKEALAEFIPNHVVGFDYCLLNLEGTSYGSCGSIGHPLVHA